jgi:hypothetical protein
MREPGEELVKEEGESNDIKIVRGQEGGEERALTRRMGKRKMGKGKMGKRKMGKGKMGKGKMGKGKMGKGN